MHRIAIVALLITSAACNRSQGEDPDIHAAKTDEPAADGVGGAHQAAPAELMPGDRGETETDRAITQRVRQNLTKQGTLASVSRNIDVITANGIVTLQGSVRTSEERLEIARIAQGSEGVSEVVNKLGIAGFEIVGE